jgi:hypothetical protein
VPKIVDSIPSTVKPDNDICICCLSGTHKVLRKKNKDRDRILYLSGWRDMPTFGMTLHWEITIKGIRSWCLTPLSTILQLYRGDQLYWWGTRKKPRTCIEYTSKLAGFPMITINIHNSNLVLHKTSIFISSNITENLLTR